ncbi:MAG: serine/threonine-protein kinase [Myxococcota bacterium]
MAAPTESQDRRLGTVLRGQYRLDSVLGRGTMGTVYRATNLRDQSEVAVKVHSPDALLADPSRQDEFRRRFERETVATLTLDHPNTVKVLDFGTQGDLSYLVLELLRGRTLRDVLDRERGPLSPQRTARIAVQIARALEHAHGHGIVHRDLKPDNVYICDGGSLPDHVKVMDFGIVRLMGKRAEATQLTQAGHSMGTLAYMSPEQATNQPVGPATDLYTLGVMVYEMITGRLPFDAGNALMVAVMHIETPPPPLEVASMSPDELAPWQALMDRLLDKSAETRLQRAGDVARMLDGMLSAQDRVQLASVRPNIPAPITRSAGPRPISGGLAQKRQAPSSKTPWWLWPLLGVGVAVVGAGLAMLVAWLKG